MIPNPISQGVNIKHFLRVKNILYRAKHALVTRIKLCNSVGAYFFEVTKVLRHFKLAFAVQSELPGSQHIVITSCSSLHDYDYVIIFCLLTFTFLCISYVY